MEVTRASFAYSSDNPVNGTDAAGLWSYGLCVTAAAGISFGGFFQFCVVTANLQEFGTTFTTGAGGQSPSASLTAGSQLSSANHLEDLGGPFAYAGGSISAAGGTAGGGCFAGHSAHGAVFGEESQLGIGTPVPVEIHGGGSITVVRRYL